MLTEDQLDEIEAMAREAAPPWADETFRKVVGLTPETAMKLVSIARAALGFGFLRCDLRCNGWYHTMACQDRRSATESLLVAALKESP